MERIKIGKHSGFAGKYMSGGFRQRMNRSRGMSFSFSIDPSPAQLAEMYDWLSEALLDLSPIWNDLGAKLGRGLVENWETEGRSLGVSWPRLSKSWSQRKAKLGLPRRALLLSGNLVGNLRSAGVTSYGKQFMRVGIDTPDYEQDVNYGVTRFQDRTGVGGGKAIPARKFIGMSQVMRQNAVDAISAHIDRVLEEGGVKLSRAPRVSIP